MRQEIKRRKLQFVLERLQWSPAVALLGPRQAGKTTLAEQVQRYQEQQGRETEYLDLERPGVREKLGDGDAYLEAREDKFVILDEVQCVPELFQTLRGLIDRGIERGHEAGRFLLLGSASGELLRQTESLTGRVSYIELNPLDISEIDSRDQSKLWLRGGFPRIFLTREARISLVRREDLVDAYLASGLSRLVVGESQAILRSLWKMLAYEQGSTLNAERFAKHLKIDGKTVARYLGFLEDLFVVRRLPAYSANVKKRLVKSPKIYVRDSGILHSLLDIQNFEELLEHPVVGASWEGFVVENLLANAPRNVLSSFYRTAAGGAEMDLVLELPGRRRPWAVEIKRSEWPVPEAGFFKARDDIKAERSFIVCPVEGHRKREQGVEVIGVRELAEILRAEERSHRASKPST